MSDVRDFGARGNGVTDDTAAFQACLDAMAVPQLRRALAGAERKVELLQEALADLLRGGEHDGPCDPDSEYEGCDIHVAMAEDRHRKAVAALAASREDQP